MNRKKILIVDDEHDLALMISMRIKVSGYDVLLAADGLAGLQMARSESPDIIILDIMMPGMDGYTVCRTLKADQEFAQIPIILLSAKSQASDRELGTKAGADAYMTKPFDAKELLEVIERLLTI